jgi:hypothetical protein
MSRGAGGLVGSIKLRFRDMQTTSLRNFFRLRPKAAPPLKSRLLAIYMANVREMSDRPATSRAAWADRPERHPAVWPSRTH